LWKRAADGGDRGIRDIGRAVATRVYALGMRVLGVKRHGPPAHEADAFAERIYGPEGLIEMISRSDYVVAAAPLTPETLGPDRRAGDRRYEAGGRVESMWAAGRWSRKPR